MSVETEYADWLLKNKLDPTVVQNGTAMYLSEAQLMDLRRQAQAARLHAGMLEIINAGGSLSDAWEWRAREFDRMHGREFDLADALLALATCGLSLLFHPWGKQS